VLSLAVSPSFATDGVLFAGTESQGLFRSNDGGRNWARIREDIIIDAINGIVMAPGSSGQTDVLVIAGDALLVSRDGGESWSSWDADLVLEGGLAAVAAPQGLDPGAAVLVGFVDGAVKRL
jgi:photosystem II stability/assembly factor-like uncharacterized protein